MLCNSTEFSNLSVDTPLFMVRYSQSPNPDFVIVGFKSYNDDGKGSLEYINIEKQQVKKTNKQKAMYRFFTDKDEMVKSLYDCFVKRKIESIPKEYHQPILDSQNNRPEIWI